MHMGPCFLGLWLRSDASPIPVVKMKSTVFTILWLASCLMLPACRCVASGAKIILSKLPVGDLATQFFADRNLFCAGRVAQDDMERVAKVQYSTVQYSKEEAAFLKSSLRRAEVGSVRVQHAGRTS